MISQIVLITKTHFDTFLDQDHMNHAQTLINI